MVGGPVVGGCTVVRFVGGSVDVTGGEAVVEAVGPAKLLRK